MHSKHLVTLALIFLCLLTFGASSRAASAQSAVMATVQQFVGGLNQGDLKKSVAACAPTAAIIDEVPPHEWQGPTACADWGAGLEAGIKQAGWTDFVVSIGKPWHIDVTGDRAYVVTSASYSYLQNGKRGGESGSIWTFALHKLPAGWRIAGWAWAKH